MTPVHRRAQGLLPRQGRPTASRQQAEAIVEPRRELFHPQRSSRTWRARLGVADDTRLLVYAGRFAPEKHLDVLIDAVQRLGPPYLLLLIGAGPLRPQGERVRVLPLLLSHYRRLLNAPARTPRAELGVQRWAE